MIPAYCLTKTIYPWVRSPSETQTGQARRPCSKLDRCVAMATVGVLFTKFKRGTGGNNALYWIHFHISKYRRDGPLFCPFQCDLLFNTLSRLSLCYRVLLELCVFLPGIFISALPHSASWTQRRYLALFQNQRSLRGRLGKFRSPRLRQTGT